MSHPGISDKEEFLISEVESFERLLIEKTRQLKDAQETIQLLEAVIHKASQIAGHIPYICSTLTEGSVDLENAALQLQRILIHRET